MADANPVYNSSNHFANQVNPDYAEPHNVVTFMYRGFMEMDIGNSITELAYMSGIELTATLEEKAGLLKAMGVLDEDFDIATTSPQQQEINRRIVNQLIEKKKDANFVNIVHHIPILRQNKVPTVEISLPDGVTKLKWNFYEDEDPKKYYRGEVMIDDSEKFYRGEVNIEDLERLEQMQDVTVRTINGVTYRKYKFKFPFDVRLGYHKAEFSYIGKDGQEVTQKTSLISAPEKCYDGLGIREGKRTWGVPVQLYEQVSENNLGIGNFSDLAQLGYILGKNGAGIIGVNPLHAARSDQPENASPYEPDSRMFFNTIYLDVTAVNEFKNSPRIQAYYNSPEFQEKVKINRRRTYVDYQTTQELNDDILRRCFEEFKYSEESKEGRNRFNVYCDENGEDLEMYATFRALALYFSRQNPAPVTWKEWPEAYRDANSPEIREFRRTHRNEIDYFKYTQWLCEVQLQQVKEACLNSGMKIGLYTDAAVGASSKGFESWYYKDLYLKGTAGARPDVLSQNGQKWWVLGYNPAKLQEMGYEPYRKTIDANMRYAGCIRIDHVLQLHRLYIYPENADRGNYIYYNPDELMAIVALESHRHKTMVIGEDLGDMTESLRRTMEDFGILSYRVLPFERHNDMYNSIKHPSEYPQMSVCAPSTHDTPPIVNQWNVQHIWQQKLLGIINDKQANDAFEQYASQREGLNWILDHYGIWDEVGGRHVDYPREDANRVPDKYIPAVATFMARTNSAVMLMPFSDIFGTSEMGNVPGVPEMEWSSGKPMLEIRGEKSYPNWRKKMHIPVEHIEDVEIFREVAGILNRYRPDGNDGRGRYYQFERMGYNNASTIDFARYKRLHEIIKHKEAYRLDQLLKNRYSKSYMDRLDNRRNSTQERYEQAQKDWDDFTNSPDYHEWAEAANEAGAAPETMPIDGQAAPDLNRDAQPEVPQAALNTAANPADASLILLDKFKKSHGH